jgi:hypothetical protein
VILVKVCHTARSVRGQSSAVGRSLENLSIDDDPCILRQVMLPDLLERDILFWDPSFRNLARGRLD